MSTRRVTMSSRPTPPSTADSWVREGNAASASNVGAKGDVYTARLTIDITPQLRGRIKIAAFQQGVTVAELLRALLEREFAGERDSSQGRE